MKTLFSKLHRWIFGSKVTVVMKWQHSLPVYFVIKGVRKVVHGEIEVVSYPPRKAVGAPVTMAKRTTLNLLGLGGKLRGQFWLDEVLAVR